MHPNQLGYDVYSYETERPERVRTIHVKGADSASYEERERYLYKPTFKPLWCDQVHESVIFLAACHWLSHRTWSTSLLPDNCAETADAAW